MQIMKDEIFAMYCHEYDTSIVFKTTYNESGDLIRQECVGWYCGEPNPEITERFSHGGEDLIGTFD